MRFSILQCDWSADTKQSCSMASWVRTLPLYAQSSIHFECDVDVFLIPIVFSSLNYRLML